MTLAPVSLPGVCMSCRAPVTFTGWAGAARAWRNPNGAVHVCAWRECRDWMPRARERCARRPGHRGYHLTRFALDSEHYMRTGRNRAA